MHDYICAVRFQISDILRAQIKSLHAPNIGDTTSAQKLIGTHPICL